MTTQMYMTFNQYSAGIIAGFTQVIFGQPFDIIKVRLQTSTHFNNISECIRSITKFEGPSAFFKGTCAPLLGTGFLVSIEMGTNELIKKFFRKDHLSDQLKYHQIFLSGALAGLLGSIIASPIEHGKIRMQMQMSGNYYTGSIHALTKIYQRYGLKGVYKGFTITQFRQTIPTGIYFLTYEYLKRQKHSLHPLNWYEIFPMGAVAGLSYWMFAYPFDIIKTRIQHDSLSKPSYIGYRGILKAFRQLKKQGIESHIKGFNVCMLRAIPVYGMTFVVFEKIIENLSKVQKLHIQYN